MSSHFFLQIYREAIEENVHSPGYWHKNFALVCEKLRHVTEDPAESIKLVKTTIAHFKDYIKTGTKDPQLSAIEDAVKQLQQYVDSVGKVR
jgi:hypothetical protein